MEEADRLNDDQDGGWVNVSSGTGSPRQSRTKGRKTIVVVVDAAAVCIQSFVAFQPNLIVNVRFVRKKQELDDVKI